MVTRTPDLEQSHRVAQRMRVGMPWGEHLDEFGATTHLLIEIQATARMSRRREER